MNLNGVRFTEHQRVALRDEARKLYAEGKTMASIAKRLRCSVATVRVLLVESGVKPRKGNAAYKKVLPEGLLTSDEAASLIGVTRNALASMRYRGEAPPTAESIDGTHGYYRYYWRSDVEKWLKDRETARQQREMDRIDREAQVYASSVDYDLDWQALLAAVDEKRKSLELTWEKVCRAAGVDPGHISRIRSGLQGRSAYGTFVQLAIWVCGYVPDEIRRFTRNV